MITAAKLRRALAAGALLAFSATAVALAGMPGQTVEVETQVKLRNKAPAFHGKVKAANENCVEDRRVKMFKQKRNGDRKLLGKARAANSGKWIVPFDNLRSAAYFAVAPKVEQGTAGTIYECLRAKSRVIAVD